MSIHLLVIEDNPADVLFLQRTLRARYPGKFAATLAASLAEAESLLGRHVFDAAMLDLSLPDSQGLATIERLAAAGPKLPIVVLSGVDDASIVTEAVRCGAQDCLLKGRSDGEMIARAIRYAMDRKQIEEELRREKVFADIVIDSIPGVFYVLDEQGRFVRWNNFLEEITGLTGEMLRGSDALLTLVADDRQHVAGKIREVFEKGLAETEARLLGKDGVRKFWFTGRRMDVGPLSYLVGSGIDITDRKRMEEEVRRSRDDLEIRVQERTAELAQANAQLSSAKDAAEAASRAKSTFLANMSHEMRTPLNAVIGMTELVLTKQIPAPQRELLSMVKDSGETLLRLIDEILDLSRIEAGKVVLAAETFDLRESLADSLKPLALRARQQRLQLAWHVDADVPRLVIGDPNRLRQIITNLVVNGIKFTERGEVEVGVRVVGAGSREGEKGRRGRGEESPAVSVFPLPVSPCLPSPLPASPPLPFSPSPLLPLPPSPSITLEFFVRDTGIGIPEDKQVAIFGMFEQADSSLARSRGGAGLGLAIASQLVGLMDGRLWVESEVGRGSRFHFTASFGLAPATAAAANGAATPEPQPRRCSGKLRILLAEDSLVNQRLAVALLEEQGHAVTAVHNGTKLLAALESATFDLVLMDVQMPEMDGLEATARIRAREQQTGTRIPIIALTAHALEGDRERCLMAGMDGYISKPIRAKALFDAIEAVVCAAPPRP